jgi:hypothetical protein
MAPGDIKMKWLFSYGSAIWVKLGSMKNNRFAP